MIKVDFEEPTGEGWVEWRISCRVATEKLIEAYNMGEETKISGLYKDQKYVYFDLDGVFSGKCAYCESLIQVGQPGDVEHFRPKGRIQDERNQLVMATGSDGNEIPHPGYYWLAYDWKNLLPACIDCNRPRRHPVNGEEIRYGKWDQFPVRNFRANGPGEEQDEKPLLLNPVIDHPEEHLEIDDLGILIPKSDRGQKCIDIFGLNGRVALVEERRAMYNNVRDKLVNLVSALNNGAPNAQGRLRELEDIKEGRKPYSIAGRTALEKTKQTWLPVLVILGIDIN